MLEGLRARLRSMPGVPKIRHAAERVLAPYLRADLHRVEAEVHRLREAVDNLERHIDPVLHAVSSANGTARLMRREVDELRQLINTQPPDTGIDATEG